MSVVYVNDCLFFVPDGSNFDFMLQKLRDTNLTWEKEDNVAGFFEVHVYINHDNGTVDLTQRGLIDKIGHAMGLDESTSVKEPAEYGTLLKDENSDTCNSKFN